MHSSASGTLNELSKMSECRDPVDNLLIFSCSSVEHGDDGLFGEKLFRDSREVLFRLTDSALYELVDTDNDWSDFLRFLDGFFPRSSSNQSSTISSSGSKAWVIFFLGSWLIGL